MPFHGKAILLIAYGHGKSLALSSCWIRIGLTSIQRPERTKSSLAIEKIRIRLSLRQSERTLLIVHVKIKIN